MPTTAAASQAPGALTHAPQRRPLLVCAPYSPRMAGGSRTILDLVIELERRGLHCIVTSTRTSPLLEHLEARQIQTLVVRPAPILDVYAEQALAYTPFRKLRVLAAALSYNRTMTKVARKYRAGGILARGARSVLLTGFAARRLRVPLIWDIGIESQRGSLVRLLHWLGLGLASAVVIQSQAQPQTIFGGLAVRRFASRITCLQPGIDPARIIPRDPSRPANGRFEVLCVGTLAPRKNQRLLLEALRGVCQNYPQARALFVGPVADPAYFVELQALIDANGLERNVRFTGWRDDVVELLAQCDLFVLCSRNEGLPHAVREAMCAGLPVAVTPVGGMGEIIGHGQNGWLVSADQPAELQAVIELCIAQPELARAVGRRAREYALEHLTLAAWADQYYSLLAGLLKLRA